MKRFNNNSTEKGFTLIEIIVSTAIFVTVMVAMLGLFNYTLQINRRVQGLREVVQGTRTFAETITREIRNGRIDYNSWAPECSASLYSEPGNTSLGLVTKSGESLCFYFVDDDMYLKKLTASGEVNSLLFNSPNFSIDKKLFSFMVWPQANPNEEPYPQIQPFVTISGMFIVNEAAGNPTSIRYQTTISTDVYDIRK